MKTKTSIPVMVVALAVLLVGCGAGYDNGASNPGSVFDPSPAPAADDDWAARQRAADQQQADLNQMWAQQAVDQQRQQDENNQMWENLRAQEAQQQLQNQQNFP